MQGYLRSLSAEVLKCRRTMAVWLALGIPVLIIGLAWLVLTISNLADAGNEQKWRFLQNITAEMWTSTCLPIGGAILIGMLWGLEHGSNQLKHILAQPPSRHATFWAKTTGILVLIALGTALLGVLCAALATMLGIGPVQWDVAFERPFRAFAASLPTIALVSWLAQRFASFALPVILGVVGMVCGNIAALSDQYWVYVPWAWSSIAANGSDPEVQQQAMLLSLAVGVALLALSWWQFARADAPN